jgi:hypothetical protein
VSTILESVVTLTRITCGHCGVPFAIPETFRAEKASAGGDFYCPNGHCRTYSETEIVRLRKEKARLEAAVLAKQAEANQQRERYFAEQREHEKTQKKMTRLKKRTAAGVCPCCQRTFQQLSRHMKTKHIEFVKEHGIPVPEPEKVA